MCAHMLSSQMAESSGLLVALCFGRPTWFSVPLPDGDHVPLSMQPGEVADHTDLPPASHTSKPQTQGRLIILPYLLLIVIHPMDSHLARRRDSLN